MQDLLASHAKKYFIIMAMPTPNGRLHLGHIGGPCLSADVVSRFLKTLGHQVFVSSGTDSYDSYVTWQADIQKKTPTQICDYYHAAIHQDLKGMQIGVDLFINPLEETWHNRYQRICQAIFTALEDNQAVIQLDETFFWEPELKKYCQGCWLTGLCPLCSNEVAGYFCEICGAHFKPEDISQPQPRKPFRLLEKQVVKNWFMQIPKVFANNIHISEPLKKIYQNFLKQAQMRMSTFSEWGLRLRDKSNNELIFFSYGFVYAYFLLLGQYAAEQLGLEKNLLASDSDFIAISSFGADNAIPVLASTYGITHFLDQYKAFDHYLINYFYYLDGNKFSTSRRHAIWVDDVVNSGISIDIVRLYLASIDVTEKVGNFELAAFIEFYNKTATWLRDIAGVVGQITNTNHNCNDKALLEKFNEVLQFQQQTLDPQHYQVAASTKVIEQWLAIKPKCVASDQLYFWLKALTLLIYPYMPSISKELWYGLTGLTSHPNRQEFQVSRIAKALLQGVQFPTPLSTAQIKQISGYLKEEIYVR